MTHPAAAAPSEPGAMVPNGACDAPRALLRRCSTGLAHLAAWWGPDGMSSEAKMDLRTGGERTIVTTGPGGRRYPIEAASLKVVPGGKRSGTLLPDAYPTEFPELFVAGSGGDPDGKLRLVMISTFEETGAGGTRVTVRQTFPAQSERDANMKMGAEQRWRQSFFRLDRQLSEPSA